MDGPAHPGRRAMGRGHKPWYEKAESHRIADRLVAIFAPRFAGRGRLALFHDFPRTFRTSRRPPSSETCLDAGEASDPLESSSHSRPLRIALHFSSREWRSETATEKTTFSGTAQADELSVCGLWAPKLSLSRRRLTADGSGGAGGASPGEPGLPIDLVMGSKWEYLKLFRRMRVWVLEKVNMPSFHGVMQQGPRGGSRMSTSLLYHGFGLVGYRYVRREFREGRVIFPIEQPRERLRCSHCGSADIWAQGSVDRTFRLPPIGPQPVLLHFPVPRVRCFDCGQVRPVKLGFADPKKHYTRAFERYIQTGTRSRTSRPAPCNAASASPSCTSSSRSPSTRSPSAKAITTSPWYSMCRPGRWRPSATAKASRP